MHEMLIQNSLPKNTTPGPSGPGLDGEGNSFGPDIALELLSQPIWT